MYMYAEIARNEGATGAEIRDAMRVGILFSGGPGIVAASGATVKFGQD
jgi:alkylhydroperoxidase/carboxymuconolactone decarboxylase family protein YurZ